VGLLATFPPNNEVHRGSVVGRVAERLKLADSLGAVSIDFSKSNPVLQVLAKELHGSRQAS
jgi:hypothetical protein